MDRRRFEGVIAVDGPAGAGKTTLGHWLSDEFGLPYLETGFVYRAATYVAIEGRLKASAWDARLLEGLEVRPRLPQSGARGQALYVRGRALDLERDLFSSSVDDLVARVSSAPAVRGGIRVLCRDLVGQDPMIISGRDTGTSILPQAEWKLFLTAEPHVRAARLGQENRHPGGYPSREVPPAARHELEWQLLRQHLHPAPDAVVVDTSSLTIPEVRAAALRHLGLKQ